MALVGDIKELLAVRGEGEPPLPCVVERLTLVLVIHRLRHPKGVVACSPPHEEVLDAAALRSLLICCVIGARGLWTVWQNPKLQPSVGIFDKKGGVNGVEIAWHRHILGVIRVL